MLRQRRFCCRLAYTPFERDFAMNFCLNAIDSISDMNVMDWAINSASCRSIICPFSGSLPDTIVFPDGDDFEKFLNETHERVIARFKDQ